MALWMCGDPEATRLLVALAADPDEDVRSAALDSMGWKRFAGGVTDEILSALWSASRDRSPHVRATAATSLLKLEQPAARERFIEELRSAIARDASQSEIYPMANMLYDPLSECLPTDLREEACRRWAKSLAGKGPPRRG